MRGALQTSVVVGMGVLLIVLVEVRPGRIAPDLLAAAVLGLLGVLAVASRPRSALALMIGFLPVQTSVLAFLYGVGLPLVAVRNLGFLKELVVAGLVIAAVQEMVRRPKPLTRTDVLALGFLGMGLLYLLVPAVLPGPFGSQDTAARLAAFRLNFLFIVTFLACRRLPWTKDDLATLGKVVLVPGLLMAVAALWEASASASFGRFVLDTLHTARYQADVQGIAHPISRVGILSDASSGLHLRVGGWFLDPLELGFFMILPVSIALRRQGGERANLLGWGLFGVLVTTLVLTLTRSSILGGVVASLLVITAAVRFRAPRRVKFVALAIAGSLLLLPVIGATGLTDRVAGVINGRDESTRLHQVRTSNAVSQLLDVPFGSGLGTNPVTLGQTGGAATAPSENAYLQVGNELGVISFALFVFLVLSLQTDLLRVARSEEHPGLATAVWAAGWGLAVNAMFLHVWLSLPVALTFWGLAGVTSSLITAPSGAEAVERAGPQPMSRSGLFLSG